LAATEGMVKPRYALCFLAISMAVATEFAYEGEHKERKDGLPPGQRVLWVDRGDPSLLDFRYGAGGSERQPQPPFRFVEEDLSGTSPKVNVTDTRGVTWNVKWGSEATPSTFSTRLVWACGYFVEPEYYIARGRIEGARRLSRARSRISKDGSFVDARF